MRGKLDIERNIKNNVFFRENKVFGNWVGSYLGYILENNLVMFCLYFENFSDVD